MSSFSKKYYSPKNSAIFLSVTWETGYKNIQVFYAGRLMYSLDEPVALVDGVKFEDSELGKIKISFTLDRPRKLDIRVNNKKFKTVNKIKFGYDYGGLIAIFTTLSVFAAGENLLISEDYGYDYSSPVFSTLSAINFGIAAAYGITAYLLSQKKPWAYFLGTLLFLTTTILSFVDFSLIPGSFVSNLILAFRFSILLFLFLQGRHIIKEMQKSSASKKAEDLLDNE